MGSRRADRIEHKFWGNFMVRASLAWLSCTACTGISACICGRGRMPIRENVLVGFPVGTIWAADP